HQGASFPSASEARLSAAIILPGSRIPSPELAARSSANETPQAWEGRPGTPVGPPTTLIPNLRRPEPPQGPRRVDGIDPHVDPLLATIEPVTTFTLVDE